MVINTNDDVTKATSSVCMFQDFYFFRELVLCNAQVYCAKLLKIEDIMTVIIKSTIMTLNQYTISNQTTALYESGKTAANVRTSSSISYVQIDVIMCCSIFFVLI